MHLQGSKNFKTIKKYTNKSCILKSLKLKIYFTLRIYIKMFNKQTNKM